MENSTYKCVLDQLVFCPNSDANLKELEYTNKVILNSGILEKLSKNIDEFDSPMIFKVTNVTVFGVYEVFVGVHEFTASGDKIYMPNHLMEKIFGQQGSSVTITYYVPPKGSFIKLKPKDENFYQIQDIKKFLEKHIQKNYPVLQLDSTIIIEHNNINTGKKEDIELIITELRPFEVISTVDTDIEVDFEEISPPNKLNKKIDVESLVNDMESDTKISGNNIPEYIPNMISFNNIISKSDKSIFIQFTDSVDNPCKIFDKMSKQYNQQAMFYKIDIGQNPGVSDKYKVNSVPTVICFNNRKQIDSISNTPEEEFNNYIKKNITNNIYSRISNLHSHEKVDQSYSKTQSNGLVPFSGTGRRLGSY